LSETKKKKRRLSVTLGPMYHDDLDYLVKTGYFIDPQEAIRDALRHQSAYYGLESHSDRRIKTKKKKKED